MKQALFLPLLLVVFSACNFIGGPRIKGDGNITTETRNISDFKGVHVSGSANLIVTQDQTYSVKVEADGNLQSYIETYKDGNMLVIRPKDNSNLDPTTDIKIYVSAPVLEDLRASGACDIESKNTLTGAEKLKIDLSGSCHATVAVQNKEISVGMSGACGATLSGTSIDLKIDGSGSTEVRAFGLQVENAEIDLSGSGDAEVNASAKLNAGASGAADIHYKGNPSVNSNASGAATIKKVD